MGSIPQAKIRVAVSKGVVPSLAVKTSVEAQLHVKPLGRKEMTVALASWIRDRWRKGCLPVSSRHGILRRDPIRRDT